MYQHFRKNIPAIYIQTGPGPRGLGFGPCLGRAGPARRPLGVLYILVYPGIFFIYLDIFGYILVYFRVYFGYINPRMDQCWTQTLNCISKYIIGVELVELE